MRANLEKPLSVKHLDFCPHLACANLGQSNPVLHRIGEVRCFLAAACNLRLEFLARLRYLSFMDKESLDTLARKLVDTLPDGLRSIREDVQANFQGVLRSSLAKLDLVTREEFEVQEAVLARTREKLESLQAQLDEIEAAK